MLKYPAKFEPAEEGGFIVEFPDLAGCITEGDTLEEAKEMAQDALTGWLDVMYEMNGKIPAPSKIDGANIHYIAPEPDVAIPILIRQLRQSKGLTQKQISEAIGIKYQAYQRFENPKTFNATVKTLKRISNVLGRELVIDFAKITPEPTAI